ncbi:MAG: peptidylprolyl isomerase, partial [Bacteroidetes bacterium]|nr:peptidylprolyl isomerase [Bacteroidota bacterium]
TKTVRDSGATAQVSSKVLQSELLHVGPFSLTTDSVLSLMKARQDYASTQFRTQPFKTSMDKLTEQLVWTVVADSIERVYPEFASILKEYEEGVLLYQVEQDNVWNRVTPNDSALHAYFDAHRDKFVWPDRVNFSEMRLPTEAVARTVAAQLKEGKTMEEVAIADSIRMAAPTQFETAFKKGSTSLAAKGGTVLARAVTDLKSDTTLRIQVTVQADTAKAKSKKLANKRLSAVSAQLTKLGLRPDRIIKVTRPLGSGTTAKEGASRSNIREADRLELNIVGRRVYVLGRIEELVLAPDADERARRADSLAIGSLSNPFTNRGTHSIVRLNKREPRREKTFDEAGGELSSAFQEAESKRLETEWLQGLRQRYPVVENKDVLKDAFAVTK